MTSGVNRVIPSVYLIGQPRINWLNLDEFLSEYTENGVYGVYFDNDATDGELLAEVAGRLCYMSFDETYNDNITKKIDRTNQEYLQESIIKKLHGSVLEHTNVSMVFDNISVLATHELVRHRAGVAYSQLSGRYVRTAEIGYYIPECIREDPVALGLFLESLEHTHQYYLKLVKHFELDTEKDFGRKKTITSALRRLLGQGRASKIMVTANIRAWRHMIEMRTSPQAEEEIRLVFGKSYELLSEEFPAFFADAEYKDGTVNFKYLKV